MGKACEYDKKDIEQLNGFVHYLYCSCYYHSSAVMAAGFSYNGEYSAFAYHSYYDDVHKRSAGVFGISDGIALVNGFQTVA